MDRDSENTKLLENIVTELQHIKVKLDNKLDAIIANQTLELTKLDIIIQNTTPAPSDDIMSLGGSISKPVNK